MNLRDQFSASLRSHSSPACGLGVLLSDGVVVEPRVARRDVVYCAAHREINGRSLSHLSQ